jgi:hypothetical protein
MGQHFDETVKSSRHEKASSCQTIHSGLPCGGEEMPCVVSSKFWVSEGSKYRVQFGANLPICHSRLQKCSGIKLVFQTGKIEVEWAMRCIMGQFTCNKLLRVVDRKSIVTLMLLLVR